MPGLYGRKGDAPTLSIEILGVGSWSDVLETEKRTTRTHFGRPTT
jgi:hypothetical protein